MKLNFEKATEDDIGYLLALRDKTMTSHMMNSGVEVTPGLQHQRVMYKFEKAKIIFVDGQRAGLLKTDAAKDAVEIIQIQIDPKFQNQGIGKLIINEIIAAAKNDGKPVKLSVLKENPAFGLYKKLGFKVVDEDKSEFNMKLD